MRLEVFYFHNKTLPLDLDLLETDLRSSTAFACTEWSIVRVDQLSVAFDMQCSMRLQVFYMQKQAPLKCCVRSNFEVIFVPSCKYLQNNRLI